MGKPGNPYGHGPHGYFRKGPSKRRVQYASSDERDDAEETEEFIEKNRDQQIAEAKKQAEDLKRQQKIQELDRAIADAEYTLSKIYPDANEKKGYEDYIKRLKAARKALE